MKTIMRKAQVKSGSGSSWDHVDPKGVYSAPTHSDISRRAYEIYVNKCCLTGECKKNWLQAESELQKEYMAYCNAKR